MHILLKRINNKIGCISITMPNAFQRATNSIAKFYSIISQNISMAFNYSVNVLTVRKHDTRLKLIGKSGAFRTKLNFLN